MEQAGTERWRWFWRRGAKLVRAFHCGLMPGMLPARMLEGLPPNNAAHVMRLSCDEATARAVSDIVIETFDAAKVAVAAFEEAPARPGRAAESWQVEAYFG